MVGAIVDRHALDLRFDAVQREFGAAPVGIRVRRERTRLQHVHAGLDDGLRPEVLGDVGLLLGDHDLEVRQHVVEREAAFFLIAFVLSALGAAGVLAVVVDRAVEARRRPFGRDRHDGVAAVADPDRGRDRQPDRKPPQAPDPARVFLLLAARRFALATLGHYIFSGAETPRIPSPFAMTVRVASHSSRRASRTSSGSSMNLFALYQLWKSAARSRR